MQVYEAVHYRGHGVEEGFLWDLAVGVRGVVKEGAKGAGDIPGAPEVGVGDREVEGLERRLAVIIDARVVVVVIAVVGGGGGGAAAAGFGMVVCRWDEAAELVQIWHERLRHGVVVKYGWSAM
jgi:hypothetical protein